MQEEKQKETLKTTFPVGEEQKYRNIIVTLSFLLKVSTLRRRTSANNLSRWSAQTAAPQGVVWGGGELRSLWGGQGHGGDPIVTCS